MARMPHRLLPLLVLVSLALPAHACSPCRAMVQAGIFDGGFAQRLAVLLLPVLLMVGLALLLWLPARKRHAR